MRALALTTLSLPVILASFIPVKSSEAQSKITTADFGWLAGRWKGHLVGNTGGDLEIIFAPPSSRVIAGVMRLVDHDTVQVVELISLVDTPNGVEMRFRHFSPALEAYEPTFKQTMRLKSHDDSSFVFENIEPFDRTLMSTQPRVTVFKRTGPNSYSGKSDIIGSSGKPAVIEAVYQRVQ
ncbi:MAG TPA: DUF6265 family protein [Gemmatimonadaceae bacterium]|nr:DUF6265 family protein [Gemmatimonadaceae bacterium]